jgi:hypothetical protein
MQVGAKLPHRCGRVTLNNAMKPPRAFTCVCEEQGVALEIFPRTTVRHHAGSRFKTDSTAQLRARDGRCLSLHTSIGTSSPGASRCVTLETAIHHTTVIAHAPVIQSARSYASRLPALAGTIRVRTGVAARILPQDGGHTRYVHRTTSTSSGVATFSAGVDAFLRQRPRAQPGRSSVPDARGFPGGAPGRPWRGRPAQSSASGRVQACPAGAVETMRHQPRRGDHRASTDDLFR